MASSLGHGEKGICVATIIHFQVFSYRLSNTLRSIGFPHSSISQFVPAYKNFISGSSKSSASLSLSVLSIRLRELNIRHATPWHSSRSVPSCFPPALLPCLGRLRRRPQVEGQRLSMFCPRRTGWASALRANGLGDTDADSTSTASCAPSYHWR